MTILQQFIADAYGQSNFVAAFDADSVTTMSSTAQTDSPKVVEAISAKAINSSAHNFKLDEKIILAKHDQDWSVAVSLWNNVFQKTPSQTWLLQDVKLGVSYNQLPAALGGLCAGVCLTFDGSSYEVAVTSADGYSSSHHGYFFTEKFSMRDGHNQLVIACRRQHNASNYQFFLNGELLTTIKIGQTIDTVRQLPTYGIYCALDENRKVRNAGLKPSMYFDENDRALGSFGAGWGGGVRIYDLVLYSAAIDDESLIKELFAEGERAYGLTAQSISPFTITHRHAAGGRSTRTPLGRTIRLWLEAGEALADFELIQDRPTGVSMSLAADSNGSEYDVFIPDSQQDSVEFIIRTSARPTYGFYLIYDLRLDRFLNIRRF